MSQIFKDYLHSAFYPEMTAEKSQVLAAGLTSCFFSIKRGHIIFLWDTFGIGAI